MAVRCPKCSTLLDATPDELGLLTCTQCGARLRTKQPVRVTIQGDSPTAGLPRIPPGLAAPADVDHVLARLDRPSPDTTVRPVPGAKMAPSVPGRPDAAWEMLLAEIRAIRTTQQEILSLLRGRQATAEPEAKAPDPTPGRPAGTGRVLLLVDDDARERGETAAALEALGTVKTAGDGNGGLASIAMEKPDAIVLELGIGNPMPGRDFVNLVKATMEWIDIPLLLHTRLDLGEEAAACLEHGADGVIPKAPGSAAALAARLSEIFASR